MTPKQVVAWKDHLFAQELDPKTVAEGYFAAARSFFKWAINNQKAMSNPFADIHVKIPKKPKLRPKSLQEDEAELILSESLRVHETRASEEFVAAKRWIPWIMAYTGARVNEITQIRGSDLTLRKVKVETAPAVRGGPKAKYRTDDVWVLNLTPQAGRIKTGEAREVPLHPHLVEQGFPEFVKKRGDGPVFYDPSLRRDGADENPQFQKVADKLADWVREIGVDDENVAPNHGWRHRFNRVARIARMDPEVRDAIKGHKPRTEGEAYGDEMPIEAKWVEILRLPYVEVAAPTGDRPGVERRKVKSQKRMATAKRAKERTRIVAKKPLRRPEPTEDARS